MVVDVNVQVMQAMSGIMKECWYKMPAARLSALRIKKTMVKITALVDEKSKTNGHVRRVSK